MGKVLLHHLNQLQSEGGSPGARSLTSLQSSRSAGGSSPWERLGSASWLWGSADTRPESRSGENTVLRPGYCSHLFNGFLFRMVLNLQLRPFSYTLKSLLKVKEFAQKRECSQAVEIQNVMLQ